MLLFTFYSVEQEDHASLPFTVHSCGWFLGSSHSPSPPRQPKVKLVVKGHAWLTPDTPWSRGSRSSNPQSFVASALLGLPCSLLPLGKLPGAQLYPGCGLSVKFSHTSVSAEFLHRLPGPSRPGCLASSLARDRQPLVVSRAVPQTSPVMLQKSEEEEGTVYPMPMLQGTRKRGPRAAGLAAWTRCSWPGVLLSLSLNPMPWECGPAESRFAVQFRRRFLHFHFTWHSLRETGRN